MNNNELWARYFIENSDKFENLSDREFFIVTLAEIDDALRRLLRLRLIYENSKKDDVWFDKLDFGFTSIVNLSYSVGLISENYYTTLKKFANIRNKFAHKAQCDTLGNEGIQKIIQALENNYYIKNIFQAMNEVTSANITAIHNEELTEKLREYWKGNHKWRLLLSVFVAKLNSITPVEKIQDCHI